MLNATQRLPLYEQVACDIAYLIEHGTYTPGERIPSVRQLSQQFQISITTVLEAYRHLENRGLIEARPQSGYYVRSGRKPCLPEPGVSSPPSDPSHVSIGELVMMILRDAVNPDLVQLGAATPNPDLLPVEKLNKAITTVAKRCGTVCVSYDLPPGCKPLRVQIARRAVTAGLTLSPDELVTTSGGQEAISLCLRALCRPGDMIAIESPIFYGVLQAIESLGLQALEIPTHPRDGISLDALRYALENNPVKACLVISNYNNPLGSCIPDANKQTLVELLAATNTPLIEDDIYGDLGYAYDRPTVAKAYDRKGLVLLCSSFSKTLAPGYRVGWIAPGRFQADIERLKVVSSLSTATLPQLAIADFLENGGYDHHLRRVRRIYAQQTHQMAEAVGRFFPEGTRVTQPMGGYVLWVEFPPYVDSLALYERALKRGITFAPGPIFSAKGKYRNFVRLNAAFWSDAVEKSIQTLGQLASEMKRELLVGLSPTPNGAGEAVLRA